MRAPLTNPLYALVAAFLVLLAAPARAAAGWGEAELRLYLQAAETYRPLLLALEERKRALPDGRRLTPEEQVARGKAYREERDRTLDGVLRKAGLSRAVYEDIDSRVGLLGSSLYLNAQESVSARAGQQRDWLALRMPQLREGMDEKRLGLLLSRKEALLESYLRDHNVPQGFATESFVPVTMKGPAGHEVRFTLPRGMVLDGKDEAAGIRVWRYGESGFLLLVHALPRPPAPMKPDFELLKQVVPSKHLSNLELQYEAPPYEFGGYPHVGAVLGHKDGEDPVEGVAFLVDAGPVVLLVMALEPGFDLDQHFAPLTLGLRRVSVVAAPPPKKRKAR